MLRPIKSLRVKNTFILYPLQLVISLTCLIYATDLVGYNKLEMPLDEVSKHETNNHDNDIEEENNMKS